MGNVLGGLIVGKLVGTGLSKIQGSVKLKQLVGIDETISPDYLGGRRLSDRKSSE